MSEEKKDMLVDTAKIHLFKKIQHVRVELQQMDLKKTGWTDYGKYYYFELSDFLPQINELCLKYNLFTFEDITTEFARITAIDLDNLDSNFVLTIPTAEVELKGANKIQSIGGLLTYARKYLYMLLFEIVESDLVDLNGTEDKKPSKKKTTKGDEKTSEEDNSNTKLKKLCTELSSKGHQKKVQDILLDKAKVRNPNSIKDEKLIEELIVELNKLEA